MATKKDDPLVDSIATFAEELERFEHFVEETERHNLTTEKGVRRAAKAAMEAAQAEQKIAAVMGVFGKALNDARARHEVNQQKLRAREKEILAHDSRFKELVERFQALGHRAKAVSAGLGAGDAMSPESLGELDKTLGEIITEAKALVKDAREADLADFARDVAELHDQLEAARKRLQRARPAEA